MVDGAGAVVDVVELLVVGLAVDGGVLVAGTGSGPVVLVVLPGSVGGVVSLMVFALVFVRVR